ncbi:Kinesin-like protein KIFC3 [Collichthys lucidus]|uniref:Kinesin-like protein n=1 Tax=Collichthys lucidus TaxID=240159 RepID=A0A4U5UV68_COLLU|nr:Kinesin-like protein KIFC3 [Collichthys lucidus]
MEDLPGSVPELKDERPRPIIHNTQFDKYEDSAAGSSDTQLSDGSEPEAERSRDDKIYIPYESAELCFTQIAEDMEAMQRRHLEMVQEMEENFQITARENQAWTVQRITSHYQNKMSTLRRILNIYRGKVEKKSVDCESRVAALTAQNEQLQEEQRAERRRSKEEALQWNREKSKMMELFSNRMDVLHTHQASNRTLEGAKARLAQLKETLYQREREITELLEEERTPVPPIALPYCTILLPTLIHKAHEICRAVPETRVLLKLICEENELALSEAREKLDHLQAEEDKESDEYESTLSLLQETVREYEATQLAVRFIKTGESPEINESDAVTELEAVLGRGAVRTTEGVKLVGQQLVSLQDQVRRVKILRQLKQIKEERNKIIENYTSERTMRKKYYNMVEDMKGKIRVFCRIRPVSRAEVAQGGAIVVEKTDEYSVTVETPRGQREFQFDKVFTAEASQDDLFLDSSRLIQSAMDGYNVCIFAYGQTGSGKTFTMVGDKDQKNPGIMPRSFNAIFDIIQENRDKFEFKVSAYMLELYNDKLQDLFVSLPGEAHAQPQSHGQARRVEIKRNRKGVVFAQGAETKEASSAQELYALFQQACANRHIAATKMNVESSRSHLIVGIMMESKNLTNGSVCRGKLSLVDLAGSERAAKTGAKDHQLKEANSINKSLSALGDVISALSAELPHVPYRNSKLTQVMQDSLGGNAKTMMIVNISPSECNLDETLTSLM